MHCHHMWLKLKLKQRAIFGLATGVSVVLLLTQTSLLAFLNTNHGGGASPRESRSREWAENGDEILRVKLLPRKLGLGGHLNMPRKDLDLSNYTSENDRRSKEGDPNNYDVYLKVRNAEGIVLNKLLADDTFKARENIQKLLVAADFIKHTSRAGKLRLDEFKRLLDPKKLDSWAGPGQWGGARGERAMVAELKVREAALALSPRELLTLRKLMPNKVFSDQKKKRDAIALNLYDERSANITAWQRFHSHISQFELYRGFDPAIDDVLYDLGHQEIVDCVLRGGGTQLKLIFYLANGARVLFKPMRFARSQGTLPNHFYFSDYERHIAEIAAFYLDRVLGFNRVVPTTGRLLNITQHIKQFAEHDLLKSFFISPAGNICFFGSCDYYCDTNHAICGKPDMVEGSFAQYLPSSKRVDRKTWRHPWRRSYNKRKKAAWETDNTYCAKVRSKAPYNEGRRLVDLTDMAIFDFLQGNLDRHHYETFEVFGNYTNPMHLDNGRGFGKPFFDDMTILAPVYQCCLIRYSTLLKLVRFNKGPMKLSDALRKMQSGDLIAPVLLEQHLLALDRRVKIILKTVYKCVEKNGSTKVVIDDGF